MANPDLKVGQAKSLRRRMTSAERRLWTRLRADRFFGLGFQRQKPVGPYIVDFFCSIARLIVELDGNAHVFTTKKDGERQAYLESEGYTVLRFSNIEVQFDLPIVLNRIYLQCEGHLPKDGEA
ncbi:MAG: DUF559 domain-containing protein [Fimbriimonas sp.]|nr:DUF559 domain-containing protein [Fimbriimonas sp.]